MPFQNCEVVAVSVLQHIWRRETENFGNPYCWLSFLCSFWFWTSAVFAHPMYRYALSVLFLTFPWLLDVLTKEITERRLVPLRVSFVLFWNDAASVLASLLADWPGKSRSRGSQDLSSLHSSRSAPRYVTVRAIVSVTIWMC
jgi:hypothetical protein